MGGQTAPIIPTGVVLSDIDDTFISSGGGTHGQDQRFEHGEIYPGAPEMYLGLALGPDDAMPRLRRDTGAARAAELCSQGVTWLSARAANTAIVKWFAGAIKPDDRISMALSNIGKKNGFGFGTAGGLYGKFKDNFSVSESSSSSKAHTKYANLQNFFASFGSKNLKNYFFLGDNGEGDEILSIQLLHSAEKFMKACFIHNVSSHPAKEVDQVASAEFQKQGRLIYYETYLGAATQAYIHGYMSITGLVRVASAIFESRYYTYCVVVRAMLHFSSGDESYDSSSSDDADNHSPKGIKRMLKKVSLHPSLSKRLAFLLEMKEASTKKYRDKAVIGQLVKRVGEEFWSWCLVMLQDEADFEKVVNRLSAPDNKTSKAGIEAAVNCLRLRNEILRQWNRYFLNPTVVTPSYDSLLKQKMKAHLQIEQQQVLIESLRAQLPPADPTPVSRSESVP